MEDSASGLSDAALTDAETDDDEGDSGATEDVEFGSCGDSGRTTAGEPGAPLTEVEVPRTARGALTAFELVRNENPSAARPSFPTARQRRSEQILCAACKVRYVVRAVLCTVCFVLSAECWNAVLCACDVCLCPVCAF